MQKNKLQLKINEWLKRYLVAEILAIASAILGGLLIDSLFKNPVLTALGATWGENIGYYGKVLFSEIKARLKIDSKITFPGIYKTCRNMIVEFGPGEILDSFLIRPVTMYYFPKLTNSLTLGLFLGKISADVVFYFFTIIAYEFRKKVFKD